ncbi:MAG: transketolase [Verrucomicrobia bacterium]|nr:transketolase [Verrucomicrobiota bacterium]
MDDYTSFGKGITGKELDDLCVNTIRLLAVDAVQKANSGHPGLPMGCADFAYVLWTQFLKHNPANPFWQNRDRFILSAGHGCMLLYSLLHLCGYKIPLEQVQQFRQLNSKTPGHPEFNLANGVETTTGPLGQGAANAVGMAIAEQHLAAQFNTESHKVIDHFSYAILGDGCNQEGVVNETVSLAGHLGLGKVVYFYDFNEITIEGKTDLAYSDDVAARYRAYHWHVQEIDGHDRAACAAALGAARDVKDRPSIIIGHTTIGFGSPHKAGSREAHGEPLGADEVKATKRNLGWPEGAQFLVPEAVRTRFDEVRRKGAEAEAAWQGTFEAWKTANPQKARLWDVHWKRELPADLPAKLPKFDPAKPQATRNVGSEVLKALMSAVPQLIGGSADLHPSTKTYIKEHGSFSKTNRAARNFHFGIREHAMGSILNGIAYHGGLIPFGSTFFVFLDYMRPPVRIASLSHLPVIYVFTHDSIFVGEDGPTHQPVEQLASLRAIPNITVIRPAEAHETGWAWIAALENSSGPTALLLTRQNVPVLDPNQYPNTEDLRKGAYVLAEDPKARVTLLASGSEVSVALDAAARLKTDNIGARVVSFPSWELFEKQPEAYRKQVLGSVRRIAIEAGVRQGWERYIGDNGLFCGMDRFGLSAPWQTLAKEFGLTGEAVAARVKVWLG